MATEKSGLRSKCKEYFCYAREISNSKNQWIGTALSRIVLCRILTGHGPLFYSLYSFCEKPLSAWFSYLLKPQMVSMQDIINPPELSGLVRNKIEFYRKCKANNIPTPQIIAIIGPSRETAPDGIDVIMDHADLRRCLEKSGMTQFILKPVVGAYGDGVRIFSNSKDEHEDISSSVISEKEILEYCKLNDAPFFLQEWLKPHKELVPIMPGPALGTVRVVTYLEKETGVVRLPYAFLKIPISGNIIDNFEHGATGNMFASIDMATGTVLRAIGREPGKLQFQNIRRHPDTKAQICGRQIPRWQEVVRSALSGAIAFRELRTLGWDIAITDSGVYVLEANWHYDPDLPQAALGRGIRDELAALYSL